MASAFSSKKPEMFLKSRIENRQLLSGAKNSQASALIPMSRNFTTVKYANPMAFKLM